MRHIIKGLYNQGIDGIPDINQIVKRYATKGAHAEYRASTDERPLLMVPRTS
jgi:hypothetical protein